jgi:dTDP-4-amino-4,6-dideoxygalactose transaminase
MDRIPFFHHDLGQAELDVVAEVLAGPILTTGETVERFERQFAEYLGRRHAVAMSSCTGGVCLPTTCLVLSRRTSNDPYPWIKGLGPARPGRMSS